MSEENPNKSPSNDASKSDETDDRWLDAHYDPVCAIYTFSQCMSLVDLGGDGEFKLVIADLGTGSHSMKLKVFRGTTLLNENSLIDLPTSLAPFYLDNNEPRVPAIAVASGPCIFIYKNLRPYYKFMLPCSDVDPLEIEIWNRAQDSHVDVFVLKEMLENLRQRGIQLSTRSLKFLTLELQDLEHFCEMHKHFPIKKQTVVTCMTTMKKSVAEETAISCLIAGTEDKYVLVIDVEAFTVLIKMKLPSVAAFIDASGLYDVEYRIIVACRNGSICSLKRGVQEGKAIVELNSQPCGLQRIGKHILVACMDDTLRCYSMKGKKLWSTKLPGTVTSLDIMDYKVKGMKLLVVGLSTGELRFYHDKYMVSKIMADGAVTGVRFGKFGREEGALVMALKRGGIIVKILKRHATFEAKELSGPPPSQSVRLPVPKKTQLFVDQTLRERENAIAMHRAFQHDLFRLRLNTAKNYVHAIETSNTPISNDMKEPVKISARIQGIGPLFKLIVGVQNTSLNNPSYNLAITFQCDDKIYKLAKSYIPVPMLVPGLNYSFDTFVECVTEKNISDVVKVFLLREGKSVPIVTAAIDMPVSETIFAA